MSKSVLTQHNDNARTGAYLAETQLKPSTVSPSTFGRLYARHVNGQIAAQPLYVHGLQTAAGVKNVVIVATQNNGLYAFDADDLDPNPDKVLWSTTLVGSDGYGAQEVPGMDHRVAGDTRGICGQTHGAMGITSAPVIDPLDGKLYVTAWMAPPVVVVNNGEVVQTSFKARHTIFVVDLKGLGSSTQAIPLTDIAIPSPPPNEFDPNKELSRPALLLNEGMLYAAFGGLVCDDGAGDPARPQTHSRGWVVAYKQQELLERPYSPASPVPPAAYFNTSFDQQGQASMAGIWQSGQGLAADEQGVYFTTGNAQGPHAGQAVGESIVRLSPSSASSGGAHNFSVKSHKVQRADGLDGGDTDLGSGGVVLLPGGRLVAGGKEGRLYVLDRANMAPHMLSSPSFGADDGLLAYTNTWHPEIPQDQYFKAQMNGPNIHGAPVVWTDRSSQTHLYAMPEKEFFTRHTLKADGSIDPSLRRQSSVHRSPDGMPGGVLSLSANGPTDGIVWASGPKRDVLGEIGPGRLLAFDAETLTELWQDDGNVAFAKFTPPTVANGKVFRPTYGGQLIVYGLLQGRPPQTVCNDALEAYRSYGGAAALGGPVPNPTASPTDLTLTRYAINTNGTVSIFPRKSSIFYSPATCGHVVRDEILQTYLGKEALLGLPITDDESTTGDRLKIMFGPMPEKDDMPQRYTHFERGSIFFSPRTDAHEIHGPIRDKWATLGWDVGLGFPKTDVVVSPDGRAQHSDFLKFNFLWPAPQDTEAAIYSSQPTGTHVMVGGIYSYWQLHPDLGLPTDDEHDGSAPNTPPGGPRPARVQDFENGTIYWILNANPFEAFSVWKPGSPAKWFDATDDEIKRTSWDFKDVNAATWAQASRAATVFCDLRGFVGGIFTGEQLNGHRGIVCWFQGAKFFDSHDAELAAQTWRLASPQLDNNAWAVAGRASDEYCSKRGFVGGFFTGHQINDLRGIVCVGAPGDAQDAQQADVDATGWSFTDVNTAPWAQAARAGHHVCIDPRFHRNATGGHFAGHQVGGARKLDCVR